MEISLTIQSEEASLFIKKSRITIVKQLEALSILTEDDKQFK
jgi:hypothetical protein